MLPCFRSFLAVLAFVAFISNLSAQTSGTDASLPPVLVLNGTATVHSGKSAQSGSLSLKATSAGAVNEQWQVSGAQRVFDLGAYDQDRICQVTDSSGKTTEPGDEQCIRSVAWFAPWTAPALVASGFLSKKDITTAADQAAGDTRTLYYLAAPDRTLKPAAARAVAALMLKSAVTIVYDASGLPLKMHFSDSPDEDPTRKIRTTISYSDYRLEQGVQVPHTIQRSIQNTVQLDFQVTGVTAN